MRSYRIYIPLILLSLSLLLVVKSTFIETIDLRVQLSQLTLESQHQVKCLADNIYHEAGFEPEAGKVAVAMVTFNRLQDPRYPKDICSVVKQRVRSTCQFSWFCQHKIAAKNETVYEQAMQTALRVFANYETTPDITNGALFYHADYVNPRWRGLEKTTVIGRHIFYKESEK
jgi:spore germination cell wall hydrolase CwlJ-like protein